MPPKVAVITEGQFGDLELFYPKYRLIAAGCEVEVMTPDGKERPGKMGYTVHPEKAIGDGDVNDYVGLLIPGGAQNPDKLRMDATAVDFVRRFAQETDKPIFSICHGPWMLVEADVVRDVTVTSWWSLRKDLENAGANWKDEEVVVDGRFITSRHPPDLPRFGEAIVNMLAERKAIPAEAR